MKKASPIGGAFFILTCGTRRFEQGNPKGVVPASAQIGALHRLSSFRCPTENLLLVRCFFCNTPSLLAFEQGNPKGVVTVRWTVTVPASAQIGALHRLSSFRCPTENLLLVRCFLRNMPSLLAFEYFERVYPADGRISIGASPHAFFCKVKKERQKKVFLSFSVAKAREKRYNVYVMNICVRAGGR